MHDAINQGGEPRQCVGFFVAIDVAIINALDANDGVTHDALGYIGPCASSGHQRARGAAQIMQHPWRNIRQLGVEVPLDLRETAEVAITPAGGENIRAIADTVLAADDVER